MTDAVIVDAVRSPMGRGKPGGALSSLHPVDLLGQVLRALVERTGIDPALVDDVLVGCVSQGGEQAGCPGRMAWLAAGLPESVPAVTIDRRCGSGQQAAHFAAQAVIAGACDIVVAGGVESMSRVPMGSARMGADTHGTGVHRRYAPGLVGQGISAELIAARWKLGRDELDAYAAVSHARAAATAASGGFDGEIVPIAVGVGADTDGDAAIGETRTVDTDETIRPGTTVERLATLKPSFQSAEMAARFPEISWSVTAGNSSQLADGASAMLIMSAERADALGLRPRARFHAFAVCGDDPIAMLTGPIPATHRILARSGLDLDDIAYIEVNEAFAPVPLVWAAEFGLRDGSDVGGVDGSRLNPRGGAIALGHPLGASGARLITSALSGLEATGGRYGLVTMCEAGGMANATLIERL